MVDLKQGVKLLQEFFFHMLFDFNINKVYNAIPLSREGLDRIYSSNLKFWDKGHDQLKIIYYPRNRAK